MKKLVFGIAMAVSALALSACGGGGGGMSTKMPTEDATALRASVQADYDMVDGNWNTAQENAGKIAELTGVDASALTDIDKFKGMLVECYNTPVKALKAEGTKATADGTPTMEEGKTAAMIAYENLEGCSTDKVTELAQTGDANVDSFYTAKLDQVDKLRMDLLYIVPSNTKALLETAPDVLQRAAEIRGRAEAALAATENNPLASAEQKATAKAEFDAVIADLDAVEGLANQILEDFKNVPTDAASLGANVVTDLENFGQTSDAPADGDM